jgi:hypothetical protein
MRRVTGGRGRELDGEMKRVERLVTPTRGTTRPCTTRAETFGVRRGSGDATRVARR